MHARSEPDSGGHLLQVPEHGLAEPVGGFTTRIDLAGYMTTLAADQTAAGKTVVTSTTEHTPTMRQMVRREAFNSA